MRIALRLMLLSVAVAAGPPRLADGAAPTPKSVDIMVEDAAAPWSRADGTGYANDVVVASFKAMGVAVNLDVVPYARCKSAVIAGKILACFSMSPEPGLTGEGIRFGKEPLLIVNADVFESRARPLPQPPPKTCRLPDGTSLGIVRQYEYPPEAAALIAHAASPERGNSDEHSLKMLATGRLDAAVVMTNDLEPQDQKAVAAGVAEKVRFAFNCGHETGTIGFSLKHPSGIWAAETYEAGYRRIEQNGELRRIRAHRAH